MEKKHLEHLKERLLDERGKLDRMVKAMDRDGLGLSLEDSVSELSTYDNHPADIGSEVFERSKDFALREEALISLAAVDQALQRMKEGTYGICAVCGREIGTDRLLAIPSTTRCIRCKEEEESIPDPMIRPVEEDVLSPPFARTNTDGEDSVIYDGEDAWQEVRQYSETTDEWSRGGAYYGYSDFDDVEDRGTVEEVDSIPYEVGEDGVIYKSFAGRDDEDAPEEVQTD
ncbi:MAG: TraR/DksA C4-type zinc finger protein [Firmicutes bacterium]|nr:TraR/DksA C4-type zinc finger protein [Bacillota bacterium]